MIGGHGAISSGVSISWMNSGEQAVPLDEAAVQDRPGF